MDLFTVISLVLIVSTHTPILDDTQINISSPSEPLEHVPPEMQNHIEPDPFKR